jgi:spermidine/putrescine transport system substrate-binding protein
MMFNGDAVALQEHEENIAYVLPQEGGLLWVDYMTVTSTARNKDLAKRFINFINEPSVAARLAEHVYYATPNDAAKEFLGEDYFSNPVIYPSGPALEKSEFHKPIPPRGEKRRNALFSRIVN